MLYLLNVPIHQTSDLDGLASVLDLMGLKVLQASFVGLVAIAKIDTSLELPELRQKLRLIAAVVDAPCVTVVQDKHVEEIGPNARKSVDFSSVYDIVGKRIVR